MNAWGALKQAVKDAPADSTIKITGTIQAATASGNYGELEITKNLSIKAKSGTATLDANSSALGSNAHRIFNVTGGTLTLNNMTLKKGKVNENGGSIYVNGGKVTLKNTSIENCSASKGGAIYAEGGCELTLNNVTIGGSSTNANKAKNGGGIYLTGSGTTGTMTGGKVSYNKAVRSDATAHGGGILIEKSASFTMNSGEISYNKSERTTPGTAYGGGVCVNGDGSSAGARPKFIFKKGRIEGNTSGYGGGVMMHEGGIFEMGLAGHSLDNSQTVIKSNSAKSSGGGVSVRGAMKMLSGTIEQNTANTNNEHSAGGGGIHLWWGFDNENTFEMSDGIITNNNVGGSNGIGKGVLVNYGDGKVKMLMASAARIYSSNDVYLADNAKIIVHILSYYSVAMITPKTYSTSTQVLDVSYASGQYGRFDVTPNAGTNWSVGSNGYLKTP